MQWYRFVSEGKVQHVFYRKFVSDALRKEGYKGYVRNLADGTVETVVFVYDEETELPGIVSILKKGSPMSQVTRVRYEPIESVDFDGEGFIIK